VFKLLDFDIYLHKHFKLDASCYGIPLCLLNCYTRTPGSSQFRFDWVKIEDNIPVQLCALVRLQFKSKPLFLYLGLECTYTDDTRNQVPPPFPALKYLATYNGGRKITKIRMDKVDGIFEPAFVVPANISEDGYIFSFANAKTEMSKARFYAPPLQFLCRDGYGNMDFQEQLHTTVRTDKRTRAYLSKSVKGREEMYQNLLKTLQQNGCAGDDESTSSTSTSSSSSSKSVATNDKKKKRPRISPQS